jgi:hypothetical protein
MTQQQNSQIVSPQQYDLMTQASGGIITAQPAQQVFQTPAAQAHMQQASAAPTMIPPQQIFQTPAAQAAHMQQAPAAPPQAAPVMMQPQPLVQTPAAQVSQIAPPGSPRQVEYEKMTHETSEFVRGMMDAAVPMVAQKAYESLPKEIQQQLAEKYAKEEAEKAAKEEGLFDGWVGKTALVGAGVGAGYLVHELISESNSGSVSEDDTISALNAVQTLLS